MTKLDNPVDMKLIYDVCKQVFCGEVSSSAACKLLQGQVSASAASLKMYFNIYACMRKGTCYKMGTSAAFTRFLIERINSDFGTDAMLIALASAKQNADYRISCNNEQPGIENTCRAIISEYKLKTKYESLTKYYGKGVSSDAAKKESSIGKTNIVSTQSNNDYLKVRITVGAIVFEAEGTPQTVIAQEKTFSKELLPNAIAALDGIYTEQKKGKENNKKKRSPRTQRKETTRQLSVGSQLVQKHKGIESLKDKMDFKAKMIPLMFLATEDKLLEDFSIKEIQQILWDALGITADKKQIVDVFDRRSDWFEMTAPNPKRYKLLDIGKDYARNVFQG